MGYTITIGELEVTKSPDDGLDCDCIRFDAKGVMIADSPAFGEPTDYTNSRWPSYSVWSSFMKAVGIYDVFFDGRGHLIGGHPGVRLVTRELSDFVNGALVKYRAENPSVHPLLNEGSESAGWLCRLIWLDYWLNWALENCETPVIANS